MAQRDPDPFFDEDRISYVEMGELPKQPNFNEPDETPPNSPPPNFDAEIYFNEPDANPPNSPGVYDMPGTEATWRVSRRTPVIQQVQANAGEKGSGWTTCQIAAISVISLIAVAGLGVAVFAMVNGKQYFKT